MFAEIMSKNSVTKLEGILKSRYGMGFRIASIVDAQDIEVGDSKGEVRGGALYVTISSGGKYLATAIMSGAEGLTSSDVDGVTEIVRLILEPALYSSYLEALRAAPDSGPEERPQNVVTLFAHNEEPRGPNFLSSLVLLESQNPSTIQRVCVHIHELGERWAMMNFSEMRAQIKTARDLRELGAMTIVISDVRELTKAEQQLLVEFASTANTALEPLILIGTQTPLKSLSHLHPDLAQELGKNRLELDRFPREFARLKQALELFLDRSAQLI